MAQADPMKWSLPGWRIEQKYANGVLIGNWNEARKTWKRGQTGINSTHRMDFVKYPNYKPDVMTRRAAMMRSDGLDNKLLFEHHNNDFSSNLISWYDEQFNKRERTGRDTLPEQRSWDSHKLAWEPEKSDHPIHSAPTNFGLRDKLNAKWQKEQMQSGMGEYRTTYGQSYIPQASDALVKNHYAPPRALSTRLHRANLINKDLSLRSVNVLQTPQELGLPTRTEPATRSAGGPTQVSM
ncbi:cilia- and flagella-associated protein 107-like [Asterias amurensis]|uniref:cilia- and flagella-associated protein 107-like n=1 Tax=Asterias amurensis TaxID=7602 RepID=UPI003AB850CD